MPDDAQNNGHGERLIRPPKTDFIQALKELFWNPREGTCCTRTPLNWLSIFIFYSIFLLFIFAIMWLSISLVKSMADKERPKYVLDDSPIGSTPSLNGFPSHSEDTPLIYMTHSYSFGEYVNKVNKELEPYKNCKDCTFNIEDLKECSKPPYGFDSGFKPCLFIKINRLILWKPDPYTSNDEFPEDMPTDLQSAIKGSSSGKVWFHCVGTGAKDEEHFNFKATPINYVVQNFDVQHFPYVNHPGYLDPIGALIMDGNSKERQKLLLSMTCSLWAKNIVPKKTTVDVLYYFE